MRETIVSNDELLLKLGLENDPIYKQYRELSLSRLKNGAVASRFAQKLHDKLENLHWQQQLKQLSAAVTPPTTDGGGILLGHTLLDCKEYRLSFLDLTRHLIVCGCSGSGKSTFLSNLILAIAIIYQVIFCDAKDEGGRFLKLVPNGAYIPPTHHRWNCLASSGGQSQYLRFFASQFSRFAALAPVTSVAVQSKLQSLCHNKDELPSLRDLATVFNKIAKEERRNNLFTAARAFDDISNTLGRWADVRKGFSPVLQQNLCVYPFKDLPTNLENFLTSLLFKQFMDHVSQSGHSSELKRLFVFDEGRGFFGKELDAGTGSGRINIQTEIMTKSRSYGMGICIGTQSAAMLQSTVVDNVGTFIAMRTNSENEGKYCCRRLGLDESRYHELMELETGVVWIVSPRCSTPVKIRIPFNDLGSYPSNAEIEQSMQSLWKQWDDQTVFSPHQTHEVELVDFKSILGENVEPAINDESKTTVDTSAKEPPVTQPVKSTEPTRQFTTSAILSDYVTILSSCRNHPELGASAHYKTIGWSAGKGNRIKKKLIEVGWIATKRISSPKGGRPKETLILTEKGEQILNES